jgi:O-antigen ligase
MGPGLLATVSGKADRTSQWAAVALGFSIPISTVLDSVLLVFVLAGWLASGAWRAKWDAVRGNPVALAALMLFGLLLLGTLYGERNPGDAGVILRKYLDLLWISMLVWVMRDPVMRIRGLYALAASLALVLLASFVIMADIVPESRFLSGTPSYPVVFKGRQTHGPLMAFGAFLYVQLALAAASPRMRALWFALAALALVNGTLVVQGATGYLVFATLALYLGYLSKGWRGLAWAAMIAAVLVAALMVAPGAFQLRVAQIQSEVAQWRPGAPGEFSSVGTRIELYRVSVAIVLDRPVLGHGTGSFTKAFADKTRGSPTPPSHNPHNEYLHLTVQLGLVGLAALLYLFVTQWRLAPRLASPPEFRLARGLILMMAVGCLFNSWLLDHTEGLFYAWLTGLLFAGLQSQATPAMGNSMTKVAR